MYHHNNKKLDIKNKHNFCLESVHIFKMLFTTSSTVEQEGISVTNLYEMFYYFFAVQTTVHLRKNLIANDSNEECVFVLCLLFVGVCRKRQKSHVGLPLLLQLCSFLV